MAGLVGQLEPVSGKTDSPFFIRSVYSGDIPYIPFSPCENHLRPRISGEQPGVIPRRRQCGQELFYFLRQRTVCGRPVGHVLGDAVSWKKFPEYSPSALPHCG